MTNRCVDAACHPSEGARAGAGVPVARADEGRAAGGPEGQTGTTGAPPRRPSRAGLLGWLPAVVAGIAVLAASPVAAWAQDVGLPVGSTPATAEVEDLEGNTVDLASLVGQGKPALVEFWATWCAQCEALEPRLQDAKKTFGDRVVYAIVGVAVNQTPRRIQRHIEDHTPVGPVYYDRRGMAVRAYMAPTTSYVVILDAAGKVVYTGTGGDQPIAATLEKLLGG